MSDFHLVQHKDDEGIDEVQVLVAGEPFLRVHMVPRYKTSGLSGDEWRVSAMWQHWGDGAWQDMDGPYHRLETAGAGIFPGVYSSHIDWHGLRCTSLRLFRKGQPVIEMSHDGKPLPLLAALGHLPWTLIVWPEQDHAFSDVGIFGGNATPDLCFQVGCSAAAVSTYALKKRFDRDGAESKAVDHRGRRHARRFCQRHLRRGNCGLDDADVNYEVIAGPGPDQHRMRGSDESQSVFGGVVTLDSAAGGEGDRG